MVGLAQTARCICANTQELLTTTQTASSSDAIRQSSVPNGSCSTASHFCLSDCTFVLVRQSKQILSAPRIAILYRLDNGLYTSSLPFRICTFFTLSFRFLLHVARFFFPTPLLLFLFALSPARYVTSFFAMHSSFQSELDVSHRSIRTYSVRTSAALKYNRDQTNERSY